MSGAGAFRDRARAESFGSISARYDRARPPYPDALLDTLATLGGTRVLDVGCGTGKASVLLAARGLQVLGVEIDPAMAEIARGHGIEVEVGSFERWDDAGRRFDLLTSAQAWHWIDPEAGARKAARVLRPSGTVALFWNVHALADEVRPRLDVVYERHAPSLAERTSGRSSRGGGGSADVATTGLRAAGFDSIERSSYEWRKVYRRDDWLELLSTFSDHHLLPDEQRDLLLAALGAAVDELGGSITVEYTTQVVLARP